MRRLMALVAAMALVIVAVTTNTTTTRAQAPTITVTPGSGSQFDTFTFIGSGFAPGTQLQEAYTSPDGETFTFYIGNDPAVVVVGGDGTFSVDVHPNVDFSGAREGTWQVSFCVSGTSDCWVGAIDIAA